MKLNEPLIEEYEINGKVIEFDLSFDNILDVLEVLNSNDFDEIGKLTLITEMLVSNDVDLGIDEMAEVYFYALNTYIQPESETYVEYDLRGNPMPDKSEKVIDFEKDAKFIFASFFMIGINLFEQQGKLTWMEFQALMSALPDDCIMSKIISIRQWEAQEGESKERKEEMRKLKIRYSLDEYREEVDYG